MGIAPTEDRRLGTAHKRVGSPSGVNILTSFLIFKKINKNNDSRPLFVEALFVEARWVFYFFPTSLLTSLAVKVFTEPS